MDVTNIGWEEKVGPASLVSCMQAILMDAIGLIPIVQKKLTSSPFLSCDFQPTLEAGRT